MASKSSNCKYPTVKHIILVGTFSEVISREQFDLFKPMILYTHETGLTR